MQIVLPASTDIYLTGGKSHPSEVRLARFMIQHLVAGDTFMDIGAHFGYFTLLASVLVQDQGKVYAFEASKSTFQLLQKNVNIYSNIKAYHQAVSNNTEKLLFYQFPVLYSEYNSMDISQFEQENWFQKFKPEQIEVPATTINHLLLKENITPKIIKIDVEGAEDKVMEGAQEALQQQNPYIVLEYLEPSRHNAAHRKAVSMLQQIGYQVNIINENGDLILCNDIEQHLAKEKLDSDNIVLQKDT
ncbi:MAG: FkbM family methyltransferase [Saprospiraceae bacterium]